jgi:transcriptional regulator with XRE-family HTH domain
MDICFVIKARLQELGLGQKELAVAADVTQSYVSQLLTHKKLPPAPERTDIYQKMEKFLELPSGNLANLAQAQRMVELKRGLQEPVRELILRKCKPERRAEVSQIFEQQPFGELERLVTQKLLDVIKRVARGELENDKWLRAFSRFSGRSYKQMRVELLDFLAAFLSSIH